MPGLVGIVELFEGDDGWRWRMRGRNGEILATSEAYSSEAKARETASALVADLGDVALSTTR